ncbi:MAG: alpha/beta fold hydrolase [Bryobacterales bacterium]|nr:alpha/beta fold hydrolase [Bryobacterales bacterium]
MFRTTLLFLALSLCANAQFNLTGQWDVTATPEGKKPLKLDAQLKQDGDGLTGQVNSPMGSGPVKNANLGNPEVAFQFLIGKYLFDVKAVANGEELKGTFNGPRNMKGVFLAKRLNGPPVSTPVEGVETGKLDAAEYRIDIPKNFNGSLVVYCHGYSPNPGKFQKEKEPNDLLKAFLNLGYAVAQSGYSKGGWAVKEALEETEALRKHFVSKYGKPKRTYVTGHSMGGTITLALAETYPDAYDAALQMCGPIAPSHSMFQRRLFDTLIVYDYYFPGMIGTPVEITDDVFNPLDLVQRIQKEATQYPDRLMAMQKFAGFQSDLEMAQVIAFYAAIQKEMMLRAGGNPFDNRNTLYQNTSDDPLVNRGVKRYAAAPQAVAYLKKYYTPTAAPKNPILSLHTTYDPLVPAWSVNGYNELLHLNGGAANFVQRFVSRSGHCTFTPQETINAFNDLIQWKESGTPPAPGEQK